jgi:ribonuclease BN (tRNA processing enzyme)
MKIKVLGCSGAEFPGRNPPSLLLDHEIVFDAGSLTRVLDVKGQLKIKHIFITHAHLDHVTGIPFLAENIISAKRWHSIQILGIPPVIKAIRKNIFNGSIWPDFGAIPNSRKPILRFVKLKVGRSIGLNAYSITPYKVNHSVPAVAYFVEDQRGRRFFYTGDTGPFDTTWEKIGARKIHCLIIEVSFPNRMEKIAMETGHLTPELLKRELFKMNREPGRILVTHLKPRYLRAIRTELQGLKIKNLRLLCDGETLRI